MADVQLRSDEVGEVLTREIEEEIGMEHEMDDTRVDFEGEQSVWIRPTSEGMVAEGMLDKPLRRKVVACIKKHFAGQVDTQDVKGV